MPDIATLIRDNWSAAHHLGAVSFALAAILLGYAMHRGTRFYAPGEGYADERRDQKVAAVCAVLGSVFFAAFALIAILSV